jgi:hypothetical protein
LNDKSLTSIVVGLTLFNDTKSISFQRLDFTLTLQVLPLLLRYLTW